VQPHEPGPFDEQEPAKKHEEHEAEVEYYNEVGAYLIKHGAKSEENGQAAQPAC
jgi:hypothetical protein